MFTKELNKLAHKIKKAHSLTWGHIRSKKLTA